MFINFKPMKKLIFLAIMFIASCKTQDQKCYYEEKDTLKTGDFEILDMGGVSIFLMEDMFNQDFKFHKIDTKEPKVRYSFYYYKSFTLHLKLYSNTDTGNDRIRIFQSEELIYETTFDEYEEIDLTFNLPDEEYSQIKFVIDNPGTVNNTPGAFQATIKIKKL